MNHHHWEVSQIATDILQTANTNKNPLNGLSVYKGGAFVFLRPVRGEQSRTLPPDKRWHPTLELKLYIGSNQSMAWGSGMQFVFYVRVYVCVCV